MKNKTVSNINENVNWKNITPGGVITVSGSAHEFNTGDWRTKMPVWLQDKCKQCLLCTPACPDSSIPVENKQRKAFDYDHCKGCGVCVKVCPFDAIDFVKETK